MKDNLMSITLFLHFYEIRVRICYLILSFILTFISISLWFEDLLFLWVKPLVEFSPNEIKSHNFIFTEVTEAFETIIIFAFGFSIILMIPNIVYTFWSYILPSCYQTERIFITKNCCYFLLLFFLSIGINYNYIIPQVWWFFLNFETTNSLFSIQYETRIFSSIKFLFRILTWITIISQTPLIIYWSVTKKWISWTIIKNKRRYAWVICLLIGALISPPDFWTQSIIVGFLIGSLEFSFFIIAIFHGYQIKKGINYGKKAGT